MIKNLGLFAFFITALHSNISNADNFWRSITLDNDIFVGNDNGYTNGVYFSWYETSRNRQHLGSRSLAAMMNWSLGSFSSMFFVDARTIGQTMVTPSDITVSHPSTFEVPYSGLLYFNDTYIQSNLKVADKISVAIGVIGPSSGAKNTQKLVHDLIGADDPKGWKTQLHDEIVFALGRGRAWRLWNSESQDIDIITKLEASAGTLETSVSTGLIARYGEDMEKTFASTLLLPERTANPIALDGGWFIYGGFKLSYINQLIFLDGNTYRASHRFEYDPVQVSAAVGFAYSADDFSLTFGLNDFILTTPSNNLSEEFSQFGTFTLAWRF